MKTEIKFSKLPILNEIIIALDKDSKPYFDNQKIDKVGWSIERRPVAENFGHSVDKMSRISTEFLTLKIYPYRKQLNSVDLKAVVEFSQKVELRMKNWMEYWNLLVNDQRN